LAAKKRAAAGGASHVGAHHKRLGGAHLSGGDGYGIAQRVHVVDSEAAGLVKELRAQRRWQL
jgi:hypothetical protein